MREERRNGKRAACADDINLLHLYECVGRTVKLLMRNRLLRAANDVDVLIHRAVKQAVKRNVRRGHFKALHTRHAVADHLLHRLLKRRIAGVSDLRRKTHHGRFAHTDRRAKLRGRHKRHLVVVLLNILRDQPLTFGKRSRILLNAIRKLDIHG